MPTVEDWYQFHKWEKTEVLTYSYMDTGNLKRYLARIAQRLVSATCWGGVEWEIQRDNYRLNLIVAELARRGEDYQSVIEKVNFWYMKCPP